MKFPIARGNMLRKACSSLYPTITSCNDDHNVAGRNVVGRYPAPFLETEISIKSSRPVRPVASRNQLLTIQIASCLHRTSSNMVTTSIDANAVIGILTLLVTCIPGIWCLRRFREHRLRQREQLIQEPENGLFQAVRDKFSNIHLFLCFLRIYLAPSVLVLCFHLFFPLSFFLFCFVFLLRLHFLTPRHSTIFKRHGPVPMLSFRTI